MAEATIDLGAALRLAGVGNPTINLAREAVREAQARLLGARALMLPSLTAGGNLHVHRGNLQASTGLIRDVDSQSFYLGAGARTLAAETVAIPGVRLFGHLGDAIYEPLAARQRVAVRASESQAVQNAVLLRVAVAYLDLVGAETRLDQLKRSEADLGEIVRLTAAYAKAGQGRVGDANRAATRADLLHSRVQRAEEDGATASARLAELLNLDPATRLHTPAGPVQPIKLADEDADISALIEQGLRNRPEVSAASTAVAEARTRVRQERVRPLLPTVSVGFSGGGFAGGSNLVPPAFNALAGRTDFDVSAVWTLQNFGFGNRALTRRATAVVGQAAADLDAAINRVRREVVEAAADARATARQIEAANRAVAAAEEGTKLEAERVKEGAAGRPIEALDSVRQLTDARQDLVRAVVGYNRAQFRLFVALGSAPPAP